MTKHKIFWLLFFSLVAIAVDAQNKIEYSNSLLFTQSNPNFKSFEIDAHKGMPLFGRSSSYQAYWKMVEMKYLSDLFDNIDNRIFLHEPNNLVTDSEKGFISSLTSWFIADLGYKMQTQEWHKKYGTFWDGSINRGTIFDIRKNVAKYNLFLKDNLAYLKNYSAKFWKNDSQEAYYVMSLETESSYDFAKKGYIISNFRNITREKLGFNGLIDYDFTTDNTVYNYSNLIYKPNKAITGKSVFFPMSESQAEQLISKNKKKLYVVYKIKLSFKDRNILVGDFNALNFEYSLDSPVITIFEDIDLKKQIGEVILKN